MATKVNLQPPDLNECRSYESYKRQLKAWAYVTDLPKGKQGNYVVLALPNKSKFGDDLKERALETCSEEDLKSETGLAKVIKFLDDELGKNAVDDIIDKWEEFDNCKKQDSQSLDEFISEFESKYNRIKLTGTKLPEEILAYMLMRRANLTHIEKMLILSRVDIEKKDDLFKNVKVNMKNILGKRFQEKEKVPNKDEIRLEAAFRAEQGEVKDEYESMEVECETMDVKKECETLNVKIECVEEDPLMITSSCTIGTNLEKLIKEEESDIKDNEDNIDIKDEILLENIIETDVHCDRQYVLPEFQPKYKKKKIGVRRVKLGKTFSCEICSRQFTRKTHLKAHTKNARCQGNPKWYVQCRKHKTQRYTDLKEARARRCSDCEIYFKCSSCEKTCKTHSGIFRHFKGSHKEDKENDEIHRVPSQEAHEQQIDLQEPTPPRCNSSW